MAPKRQYARVDSGTRFRTLALRTVWTSAVFAVGVVVGYVAPDDLPERFRPTGADSEQDPVGIEVSAVPRDVYTVDNEMTRRREEARAIAAAGAETQAVAVVVEPGAEAVAVERPAQPVAVVPVPPATPAVPERVIGAAAVPTTAAEPRVIARSNDTVGVVVAPSGGDGRAVVPPPRPVATTSEEPAEQRVVRRTVTSTPGEHPFEVEVLPGSSESAAADASARLRAAGLDSHSTATPDGRFRVVIRGRGDSVETDRQRRLAARVLAGDL